VERIPSMTTLCGSSGGVRIVTPWTPVTEADARLESMLSGKEIATSRWDKLDADYLWRLIVEERRRIATKG